MLAVWPEADPAPRVPAWYGTLAVNALAVNALAVNALAVNALAASTPRARWRTAGRLSALRCFVAVDGDDHPLAVRRDGNGTVSGGDQRDEHLGIALMVHDEAPGGEVGRDVLHAFRLTQHAEHPGVAPWAIAVLQSYEGSHDGSSRATRSLKYI